MLSTTLDWQKNSKVRTEVYSVPLPQEYQAPISMQSAYSLEAFVKEWVILKTSLNSTWCCNRMPVFEKFHLFSRYSMIKPKWYYCKVEQFRNHSNLGTIKWQTMLQRVLLSSLVCKSCQPFANEITPEFQNSSAINIDTATKRHRFPWLCSF